MGSCLIVLLLGFVVLVTATTTEKPITPNEDPACFYTMMELVCSEGYHIQEHTIETDDGYILTVFRIPNGKRRPKVPRSKSHYSHLHLNHHPDFDSCIVESSNETSDGPAVLMSHGLNGASDCFILQGPGYDLSYILVDKGYDVWFTNIRGNFYSRRHKTLKPSEKEFWDFSFHENGVYDITKIIDYILEVRGLQKIFYVGHSMGTTMFFVMASWKPEYNEKIQLSVALAPVGQVWGENFTPPKKAILGFVISVVRAYIKQGIYELLPRNYVSNVISQTVCAKGSPLQDICYDFCFFFNGYPSKLLLRDKLAIFLTHGTSGSSVKTFHHYVQLLRTSSFPLFDYGTEENLRRYSQERPPEYDVRKVTAPTALFYSTGDYIADIKNVNILKSLLPNVVYTQEYSRISHVDFIWAYTARTLIYSKVVDLMEQFRTK